MYVYLRIYFRNGLLVLENRLQKNCLSRGKTSQKNFIAQIMVHAVQR